MFGLLKVRKYRQERDWYYKRRERALPEDRRCPNCLVLECDPHFWSVKKNGRIREHEVICRSCAQAAKKGNPDEVYREYLKGERVFEEVRRFKIDPDMIRAAMVERNWTISKAAFHCGMSKSRLDRLLTRRVPFATAGEATILRVSMDVQLEELSTAFRATPLLRRLRQSFKIAPRRIGDHLGWSESYQRKIETGGQALTGSQASKVLQLIEKIAEARNIA